MEKLLKSITLTSLIFVSGCTHQGTSSTAVSNEAHIEIETEKSDTNETQKMKIESYLSDNYGYYPNLDIQYRCWTDSPSYYSIEYILTTPKGEKLEGEFGLQRSPCIFFKELSGYPNKFISLHLNPGEKNRNLMAYVKLCDISNGTWEDELIYSNSLAQLSKGKFSFFLDSDKFGILEQTEKNPGQINSLYSVTKDPAELLTPIMNPSYHEELILKDFQNFHNIYDKNIWSYKKSLDHHDYYDSDTSQYEIFDKDKHYYFGAGFTSIARNDWDQTEELYSESEVCELINTSLSDLLSNGKIYISPNSWDNKWNNLSIELDENNVFTLNFEFPPCSIESENSIISTLAYEIDTHSISQEGMSGKDKVAGDYITPEEYNQIQGKTSKSKEIGHEGIYPCAEDLDGFWVSDDYRYFYIINFAEAGLIDTKYNNYFTMVDLRNSYQNYAGSVKVTSNGKVHFNTNQDSQPDLTFQYQDGKLIGNDFSLSRTVDQKTGRIIGFWGNNNEYIEFKEDGFFKYKRNGETGWGEYYFSNSQNLVMSDGVHDFKLYSLRFNSNGINIYSIEPDGSEELWGSFNN